MFAKKMAESRPLDMRLFDPRAGYYEAPPHLKANNGLFIVDDLGRQRVTPRELMNRWIVPMERRHDHLTLRQGARFTVPFELMLVFSSNLSPDATGLAGWTADDFWQALHLGRSRGHHADFIGNVKSRGECKAPPEVGHSSASICHLNNIAMLLGRKLKWDPDKEQFINDDEANRMLVRLNSFNPDTQKITLDLNAMYNNVDLTSDTAGAPGCMSGKTDTECQGVFSNLKIDLNSGAPATAGIQSVFIARAK